MIIDDLLVALVQQVVHRGAHGGDVVDAHGRHPRQRGADGHERHVERAQRKRVLFGERNRQREHGVHPAGQRHALEEAVARLRGAEVVEQHVVAGLVEDLVGAPPRR